jgi:hypothetical protein
VVRLWRKDRAEARLLCCSQVYSGFLDLAPGRVRTWRKIHTVVTQFAPCLPLDFLTIMAIGILKQSVNVALSPAQILNQK